MLPAAGFGIRSVGFALGERCDVAAAAPRYTTQPQKVRAWGYQHFHRAPDDTGLTDLAAAAGRQALDRAGVPADAVDLVVLAMADIAEFLYWDPSAATQAKLGTERAESVLVNQACSSGVASFDVLAGKFATHPDYRVALLIAANRVCEQYWNRMESSLAVTSDGAVGALVVRDHPRCRWLVTEVLTDGRYVDFSRLPGGGAARPVSEAHPSPGRVGNPADLMAEFLRNDPRAIVRFVRQDRANAHTVFKRACRRAGIAPERVRHLLHMNAPAKGLHEVAKDFGVPLANTNADIALNHGHFGSADQLLALGRLLDDGALGEGDIVALCSNGNGMHWACTLIAG